MLFRRYPKHLLQMRNDENFVDAYMEEGAEWILTKLTAKN